MFLQRLVLRNFRNYEEASLEFSPKVNLLRGDNAQGKTNLLEAIFLISTGRSFRTSHLPELIREEAPNFYLEAEFFKDEVIQTIRLSFDGQNKKMVHDGATHTHFTSLLGLLPTVLLAPEDIEIVVGPPQIRRRFLDLHLAQVDPAYICHLARYYKAMKQRNALLRRKIMDGIESFETLMAVSAVYLHQKRGDFLQQMQEPIRQAMSYLSDANDYLQLKYFPSHVTDYAKHRSKELEIGSTLMGPHRDDFEIEVNGKEAKSFASQGQKRCAITALKIGQWDHFYKHFHSPPLFSIDDFGAHLDSRRSQLLLSRVSSLGQVFLTSPYEMEASADLTFRVLGGKIDR